MPRPRFWLILLLTSGVAAGTKDPPQGSAGGNGAAAVRQEETATGAREPARESDAERISRLQQSIADTEKHLADQRAKLTDPEGEYSRAESAFTALDRDFQAKKKELQRLTDEGESESAAVLTLEIEAIEPRWKLAKDRFDLAIQERKGIQEQIQTLEKKIQQEREALARMLSPPAPVEPPVRDPAAPPSARPASETVPQAGPPTAAPAEPAAPPAATAPVAAPLPGTAAPATPTPPAPRVAPPSRELVKAQEEASVKEARAREAEQELQTLSERLEGARKSLELERRLLATARKQSDNAHETQLTLSAQLQTRTAEHAPAEEIESLWKQLMEAQDRFAAARREVAERIDRLERLQVSLNRLQSEHIAALEQAEQERKLADSAARRVEKLENPFTPQNLLRWVIDHGPRILGIAATMILLLWLSRVLESRIVKLLAVHTDRGSWEERENRAKTLVGVFHNAVSIAVVAAGVTMILSEVGFNVVPLLGGAAVVGLAVAFGAQNLIRDYFYGFMILMENQYGINDVVRIGSVSGLVERITLRITVLRDLEGIVHFIPNGQLSTVSNMTHGWSRALFDIPVSYRENVDRVIEVLMDLARDMRRDPNYRGMILEAPEMLGVNQFDDSAVIVRFFIKTRPLKQWLVKRELLRRIKNKFDEVGIEIPFPHRTVYHRAVGPPGEFAALGLPSGAGADGD